MSVTADTLFNRAAAGLPCWIGDSDGSRQQLPTERWMGGSASSAEDRRADHAMLSRCTGPTIDLGCGPGRLTEALARRGVSALGVDTSRAAVDLTIGRGGNAVLRDLFEPLPDTGNWSCVLLADGNIGIGGDPVRLLRRAADLLAPHGAVIVEVDAPSDTGIRHRTVRWETDTMVGDWFAWSSVSADATADLAGAAGLRVVDVAPIHGRWFAQMTLAPFTNS
ncbi:methyltransferase domain-containing protein [Rhodococcus sp. IEGM 1401]|uniref:methyltransferase domain-containing protein n=1 Tax=unclassified Rhodococcus (in: high G+C Gram-positive bacteria) TaxID=192944 RepID=UPI0022B5DC6E|nr:MULTISPECIES: methyltransferase domain-containing protein [unclassified Rhodococcus (in: high G+C Gram-positive bacteria)]MCZ4560831.1 methyltransferase domain-containing protein [Rhodococcus sp. IEGM 1401]MDI9920971.1 methyltransferase domain-containing protein [Rhodococcus sp. IEGM 1372]MDV8033428.1 methyltransferase domain-containing protein [Rhodococcus sp. IEGM 1414]